MSVATWSTAARVNAVVITLALAFAIGWIAGGFARARRRQRERLERMHSFMADQL